MKRARYRVVLIRNTWGEGRGGGLESTRILASGEKEETVAVAAVNELLTIIHDKKLLEMAHAREEERQHDTRH